MSHWERRAKEKQEELYRDDLSFALQKEKVGKHYELTVRSFFTLQVKETNRSSESLYFEISLKRDS